MSEKITYTPEAAEKVAEERNTHYDALIAALSPVEVKARAQWCVDHGYKFTQINSYKEEIVDDVGDKHKYWTVGKNPTNKGWPVLAYEGKIIIDQLPNDCNVGIQTGTPVERNGRTYYVLDLDFDDRKYIRIWQEFRKHLQIPNTFRYGHASKRDSHSLFLITEPVVYWDGDGKVERRCQSKGGTYVPYGHQTVMPGSIWTDGNKIEPVTLEEDSAADLAVVETELIVWAHKALLALGECVC